jgi:two-component system phosphoglycerate transport system response regulator PgtA
MLSGIRSNRAAERPAGGEPDAQVSPATVCLLDDDLSVLKATGRLVRAAGLEVKTFSDPHAFLQHAHQYQPRVAVIDIWMPAMNGLEVQQRVRSIAPATRVIVLTSKDDPGIQTKAIERGAFAFFLKPVAGDEFVECIRTALNGSNGSCHHEAA